MRELSESEFHRYARHLILDEVGEEGQGRLLEARVLIVGAGGLGAPVSMYLAAAGVGTLVLVDDDEVDLTNLQRQIVHRHDRIGQPKAASARRTLLDIDPGLRVDALAQRADAALLDEWLPQVDLVLDCSDNFRTRHAVNAACVRHHKPLVSGAAIGFDGQVAVYDSRRADRPCYACLFPPEADYEEVACATMGVFAPLVGIIGCVQAAEALKLIIGIGDTLAGRLLMLDARSMEWTEMKTPRNPACSVCAGRAPA